LEENVVNEKQAVIFWCGVVIVGIILGLVFKDVI